MKTWHFLLIFTVTFVLYSLIYVLRKKKKPCLRAFGTMGIGVLTLILVDITGVFTGVYLPISALSLSVSAVGGLPGIAAMLVIENFL